MGNCFTNNSKAAPVHVNVTLEANGTSEGDIYTVRKLEISTSLNIFSYAELCTATKNFQMKLGEGGFGAVYKGELPPSKQHWRRNVPIPIAVKRISVASRQGDFKEFEAEARTYSGLIRHRNLVALLGWSVEHSADSIDDHRIALVYEFVANRSLDDLLHKNKNREKSKWARRLKIVCEIAEALVYLHHDSAKRTAILHRDIKPSNIMLDESYIPKLGDLGLARTLPENNPFHVGGSRGYMAPELFLDNNNKFTKEADMYSFGVVVLEVASGKRPMERVDNPSATQIRYHNNSTSTQPLVESVWDLRQQGRLLEAADKRLHQLFDEVEMNRVLKAGLACCHPDPQARLNAKEALDVLSGVIYAPFIPKTGMPRPPPLPAPTTYQTSSPTYDETS